MKTNLDVLFKTNSNMEKDGIWFEISDKTAFQLKRFGGANSPELKRISALLYKPYTRQIENGTIDPEKDRELGVKAFVMSTLVNWRGVEIDGVETPFSQETAIKFFLELPELLDVLIRYSSDVKNYREELGNF